MAQETAAPVGCRYATALFLTHGIPLNTGDAELFALAREVGFRTLAVPWKCVEVREDGTYVRGGSEVLGNGARAPIFCRRRIVPRLIFHRMDMTADREKCFRELAEANPDAWLSYHPEFKFVGSKWGGELCLRAGERRGVKVARPETYLVPKQDLPTALARPGKRYPLVFKPGWGTQGRGILVSTPESFEATLEAAMNASTRRFAVQKMQEDAINLDGRRFDLRLYCLVSSFRPLRYTVYREGIVRVAAQPWQPEENLDLLGVLTNCAYRASRGASVENLTVAQLLDALARKGFVVDSFWERIDRLAGLVFECYANWEPLARLPDLPRLVLLTGLDVMLVNGEDGVQPLFIESNYTPLLHGFGPPAVEEGLLTTTRQWLTALVDKCGAPASEASYPELADWLREARSTRLPATAPERNVASIRLPQRDTNEVFPTISGLIRKMRRGVDGKICLNRAASVLNRMAGRQKLIAKVCNLLSNGNRATLRAVDEGLAGFDLDIRQDGAHFVLDACFDRDADLRALRHPLVALLPQTEDSDGIVKTRPWPGAQFEYLDPKLAGPAWDGMSREEALLVYLGRIITKDGSGDPLGGRCVEPGVGRTALVDFLRIEGRPDLNDFSVLGIGLTPYSESGFILKGPEFDGLCSLKKSLYRQKIERALEKAGCRVPKTAAIIRLPGLEKTWPDGSKEPAAVLVRGFRTVLRVQQLDPLHGFSAR